MRLVTTTGDFSHYYRDRSVAAPLDALIGGPFRHIDLSMYNVVYDGSPWTSKGDGWKKEIEDCARIASENGLDFCQAHSPAGCFFKDEERREKSVLATVRSIEACAMLGVRHTVIHAEALGSSRFTQVFGRKKFLEKNIELFRLFGETAERFGVDILVENSSDLWNRGYFLNSGKDIRDFVEKANVPRLFVCWDVGHANCQGADQYKEITAIGDKVRAFHMQDNCGNGDAHVMPMMGTINWDQVMRAIKDIGYAGDFTFECDSTIRRAQAWPFYRRDVKKEDVLSDPPLAAVKKQLDVTFEIGKWMLESYGFTVE